jgi:DNA-binding NarL/FixJ family response regulator
MDQTAPPTGTEKLRTLIVDDEAPARARLRRLLEEIEDVAVVGEAANGQDALAHCASLDPDVVLLDVRMPGMDGIEATRLIKARWPHIRVIVLSIYSEYRQDALAAGADIFIGKAEPPENLLQTLSSLADATATNSTSSLT